jgi:hypothetical protein
LNDARDSESELAALDVRREEAVAERDLAREVARRLGDEVRRLELELAQARTNLVARQGRLEELETYVKAVHSSSSWRALQTLRGLVGRRW